MHFIISKKTAATFAVLAAIAISYPSPLNATTVKGTPPPTVPVAETPSEAPSRPAVVASSVRQELVVQEPSAMDIWLAKLIQQESGNRSNLKVLDVNGLYSYGCLLFQEGTFRNYALKYGFISYGTPTESKIYDCELQKKIAKRMIAEDYSNWRAWYNSVKRPAVGLSPKGI